MKVPTTLPIQIEYVINLATGSVDLSSITDEKKKRQLESMINNFGQTPTQLFYEPHPPRLSLQEARKLLAAKFSTSGQNSARSIFENLKELRAFSVEVDMTVTQCANVTYDAFKQVNNEPLIMVASPTVKLDTIIASGNPELVVSVCVITYLCSITATPSGDGH